MFTLLLNCHLGSNLLNSHFLTNNAQQILSSIQPPNILPTLAAAAGKTLLWLLFLSEFCIE